MPSEVMTDHEAFMVVCAVRYALGRQSYAPSIVMKEVRRLRPRIPQGDILVIVDSIRTDLEYLTRLGGTVAYGDEWAALADELAPPPAAGGE